MLRDFSVARTLSYFCTLAVWWAPGDREHPALMMPIAMLNVNSNSRSFLLPRCYVRHADPNTSEQIGFHLSRNSLWIARITNARVNNRVMRFRRRFPARLTDDRLGLTDRLIQSQTSVDARLCRFTFQLSDDSQSWVTRGTSRRHGVSAHCRPETPADAPSNWFELTQEKLYRKVTC